VSNHHPAGAGAETSAGAGAGTNRLAGEASPYLQQHARNPVDWFPWGPEALTRARTEDKPILLSIGYSACHWCHVMERESFEDAAIAAQMNESFVSIKVDREERPDLDQIYQLVVQLMGRNGGWPLTVFLTPDQRPFFGGTYFPPADKYGMPGFSKILAAVSDAYRARRDEVDAQAKELTAAIASVTAVEKPRGDAYAPGPDLLERAVRKLSARFDDENGGLGTRPKFPNTMALDVFLRRGALEGDSRSLARMKLALDKMRGGGIYDQLGHGFHRYSTDERWLVPHFEKMLYDNALLLRLYTDAFRATEEPRFAATAREIAAYVEREMTDVDGGFYATQDADSEGEEGRFFVWSPAEIDAALAGDEEAARVAKLHWGVTVEGNFEESGKTVLHVARPVIDLAVHLGEAPSALEDAIERARRRLFAVREARPKPFRDEKILVSWNALMIGALADAGATLGEPALVAIADRAFRFLEAKLVSGEGAATRVERHCKGGVVKGPGFLDDYAFLAVAALDLFEATGDARHVTRARGLADAILARFWDAADGGFFFTPEGGEALIHRAKDPFDHAIPSGTSMACKALLRLSVLVDARYADAATRQLESIATAAVDNPFGFGQTLGVLDRLVRGSVDVVIAGDALDPRARALHYVALHAYLPNRNLAWLRDADARAACALLADGKTPGKDGAVAYVCRGRTCSLPLSTPDALRAELRRPPARG
jgi:uncharacterized protein YyaL (SSP411 family)